MIKISTTRLVAYSLFVVSGTIYMLQNSKTELPYIKSSNAVTLDMDLDEFPFQCGEGREQSIPECSSMMATCIKTKCNDIPDTTPSIKVDEKRIIPLPLMNRTSSNKTFLSYGYAESGFRLHVCKDVNIGFVHIFKSAGSYSIAMFKNFCRHVTGKPTITFKNEVVDPNMILWTVIRNPEERFISAMFELARRRGEENEGGIASIVKSVTNPYSTNETIVADFLNVFLNDLNRYDHHLHPQIDFLMGHDNKIYKNLNYVLHLDDGDLETRLYVLFRHMFKEVHGYNHPNVETFKYKDIRNTRSHKNEEYGLEESNPGVQFFKDLRIDHLNAEFRNRIHMMYRWDETCFASCGY